MFASLVLISLLVEPLIGDNITSTITSENKMNVTAVQKMKQDNATLITEGGSVTLDKHIKNIANSENIDELKKKNKIKGRKGVNNEPEEISASTEGIPKNFFKYTTESEKNKTTLQKAETQSTFKNITIKHIKKQLILDYDTLAGTNDIIKENKMPTVQSSSKSLVSDQIPSPNNEAFSYKSIHLSVVNKNPGMIMPIVITVLLLPAFGILGYLAVKRGKEAWKNRHYKRMDYLLDGMYND